MMKQAIAHMGKASIALFLIAYLVPINAANVKYPLKFNVPSQH